MSPTYKSQLDPLDVELEEKSRRPVGQYLREKYLNSSFYVVAIAGVSFGLLAATLLFLIVVGWFGLIEVFTWVLLCFAFLGTVLIVAMIHSQGSWSLRSVLKGLVGETTIADVIERSMLQAFGCFVANDVVLRNNGGNIDHVVTTPRLVLVIETKFGRVPNEHFRGVPERIARMVEEVQGYLGSEVEVRGCLAFADANTIIEPEYPTPGGQTILAFTPPTLKRFLTQECVKPRTLSEETLQKVAQLGFDAKN